jgi:hypothetical protein
MATRVWGGTSPTTGINYTRRHVPGAAISVSLSTAASSTLTLTGIFSARSEEW